MDQGSADEYGFYSNVNPDVAHKRWSQSHERRLGEFGKRKPLPFNGYAGVLPGSMPAWTYANTSDMTHTPDTRQLGSIKAALFLICLLPFGRLLWAAYTGDFGPNWSNSCNAGPATWTFNLLLITLCITPLRVMAEWHWLIRLRRMLGLFLLLLRQPALSIFHRLRPRPFFIP